MESVKCDLCGSDDYKVLWDKEDHQCCSVVIEKDGKMLNGRNVICKRCGLIYVNPRMTKEELDHFYEHDYRKIYNDQGHQGEKAHTETALYLIRSQIVESHLDIGCATGDLIERTGGEGVEPNLEYCKIAREKGLTVYNTTIEAFEGGQYGLITMFNALEHVVSPTETLLKIRSHLIDGGKILISVPDFFTATINTPIDVFLSNAHLYSFTIHSVENLMRKCGFKVLECFNHTESIGNKLYILAEKAEPKTIILNPLIVKLAKQHLENWQQVAELKSKIAVLGYY